MYLRLIEKRRTVGASMTFGDAREVAGVIADAGEAANPEARYLVGKDAEQIFALTPAAFEGMIDDMIGVPDEE